MSYKPLEASHVCSVLDDCAAVGNVDRLNKLIERADKHLRRLVPVDEEADGSIVFIDDNPRAGMWTALHAAAVFRRDAIQARLAGNINQAVCLEYESEKALRLLAILGRIR